MTIAEIWERGQAGWPRSYPIAQFPNVPLLIALGGSALAALSSGSAHDAGRAISTLFLGAWAWGEAAEGVNSLRRLLGVGVLLWLVVRLAGEL